MHIEASDDQGLLSAIADGSPLRAGAAETFVTRHAQAVRRLAQAIVGDSASAEDVTQETFARVLVMAKAFDPAKGTARTWVLSIARHVALELLRRRREMPSGDASDSETLLGLGIAAGWGAAESPEAVTIRAERREHLAQALASLEPRDREILVLRELEGLDGAEVARVLNLDLAGAKSRLHRARLRLMAAMGAITEGVMTVERKAGGMSCSDVLAVLSDYVDDDLGMTDRARVESHLRECSVCERFGGRFSSVVHDVRNKLGAAPAVDMELVRALTARLR